MTDWNKKASGDFADKIEPGMGLKLRVKKILHASKKGEFRSRKGDPQIMVVFTDGTKEAATMLTLSEEASWTLAKLLVAIYPSGSVDKLGTYGVEPHHFAVEEFADQMLKDREVVCDLAYDEKGFAEFEFHKWTPNLPDGALTPLAQKMAKDHPLNGQRTVDEYDPNAGMSVPF